jgi:hypothetical protein
MKFIINWIIYYEQKSQTDTEARKNLCWHVLCLKRDLRCKDTGSHQMLKKKNLVKYI